MALGGLALGLALVMAHAGTCWRPAAGAGESVVVWDEADGFGQVAVVAEDVDLDGVVDRVERAASFGSGFGQVRDCARLSRDGSVVCRERMGTAYARTSATRVFVVQGHAATAATTWGQTSCGAVDADRPEHAVTGRLMGHKRLRPMLRAPLRWLPGAPVAQACASMEVPLAAALPGGLAWWPAGGMPDDCGWRVVRHGGMPASEFTGDFPGDDPVEVLRLPSAVIYQARHALAVWSSEHDEHAWLGSFEVAVDGEFKVDRWPTIVAVEGDGDSAFLVTYVDGSMDAPERTLRVCLGGAAKGRCGVKVPLGR